MNKDLTEEQQKLYDNLIHLIDKLSFDAPILISAVDMLVDELRKEDSNGR